MEETANAKAMRQDHTWSICGIEEHPGGQGGWRRVTGRGEGGEIREAPGYTPCRALWAMVRSLALLRWSREAQVSEKRRGTVSIEFDTTPLAVDSVCVGGDKSGGRETIIPILQMQKSMELQKRPATGPSPHSC